MKPRFLADADLHFDIVSGVLRREPAIDFETLAERGESPGLLLVPQSVPTSVAIEELVLVWVSSEAEEWRNRVVWLPL